MVVQIQIRRDSAADWTNEDPTLAEGEIGYETDTGKLKIGDGSTAWTALAYIGLGQEIVEDWVGGMVTGNTETLITVTYQDADGTLDFVVDEASIDHDALTNFSSTEHFTMLDQDNLGDNDDTKAATQQSIKAYVDAAGGTDDDAIHDNVASEISALVQVTPAADDEFIIEDYSDSYNKKAVLFSALEGAIDHANVTNTHDLTGDIDHDTIANNHNLTTDIDHDNILNFAADEHFTMLDEDNMVSDSDTQAATQQSIKKYVDDNAGGMNDIVEDVTPQLGGDLDLNGKNIDFPTTANISDCKDEDNMASDSATMLATQQSIKAYVDDATLIGAGKVAWFSCGLFPQTDSSGHSQFMPSSGRLENILTGTIYFHAYLWGVPFTRGSLSLRVTGYDIIRTAADANNYVDEIKMTTWNGTSANTEFTHTTNYTSAGTSVVAFTAVDLAADEMCSIRVKWITDTQYAAAGFLLIRGYYA